MCNIIIISCGLATAVLRLRGGVVGDFSRTWARWERLDRHLRLRAASKQNPDYSEGRRPFRSDHSAIIYFSRDVATPFRQFIALHGCKPSDNTHWSPANLDHPTTKHLRQALDHEPLPHGGWRAKVIVANPAPRSRDGGRTEPEGEDQRITLWLPRVALRRSKQQC